jgi:hypothetical protein
MTAAQPTPDSDLPTWKPTLLSAIELDVFTVPSAAGSLHQQRLLRVNL